MNIISSVLCTFFFYQYWRVFFNCHSDYSRSILVHNKMQKNKYYQFSIKVIFSAIIKVQMKTIFYRKILFFLSCKTFNLIIMILSYILDCKFLTKFYSEALPWRSFAEEIVLKKTSIVLARTEQAYTKAWYLRFNISLIISLF